MTACADLCLPVVYYTQMLKRIAISLVVLAVAFGVLALPVRATDFLMSDSHAQQIVANCRQARATLGQIHANDAPDYVNKNQVYFSISDKLMSRLNGRLTLNSYDASDLVKTASEFSVAIQEFRDIYRSYDSTMARLVKIDCTKHVNDFYGTLVDARTQRDLLHQSTMRIKDLITKYGNQVQEFERVNFGEVES